MEIRNLGSSGLKISAIAYGNWLTHGSQVEEDAALACVRQALDEGITTFDTADVYANTKAETVLGKALKGERREGLEIFTKVYWPTGPGEHNDHGLSRKHILESINGSLKRLGTDYVDLYQAHRYDYETPLEETMEAFADVVHSGKAHYIGVSEWRAEEIRAAHQLARELRIPLVSNQPQYNMLWRVIEAEVVPTCEELGIGQIVWSPIAPGRADRQVQAGRGLPGRLARHRRQGRRGHDLALAQRRRPRPGAAAQADRRRGRPVAGPARGRLDAAEQQRLGRDHRRLPARAGHRERQGGRRDSSTPRRSSGSTRSSTASWRATRPRPSRPPKRDFGR